MSISLINQPPHFFAGLLVIVSFALAVFSGNEKTKSIAHKVLYVGYGLMLLTGCYLFSTLPFSIWVLIKSVGGVGLIVMAELIVRGNNSKILWGLLLLTSAVGLAIAYFLI